ncbi:MAG: GNAT family N-acetyltransferase [Vulcanimicrobiaceae bacterium]
MPPEESYGRPYRATVADVATVVTQRARMFAEMGVSVRLDTPEMVTTLRRWFHAQIAAETYLGFLIANESGAVVAGGGVRFLDWPPARSDTANVRGYLMNVYVEPDHRRRGLARSIATAAIDACRRRGVGVLALHASAAGRPLYESLGFEPTPEMCLRL